MRRTLVGFGVALVGLSGLLGMRIAEQRAALTGPSGGSGVVEATSVHVSSRVGGRIVERAVTEGQPVKAGDLILRLDCAEPDAALAEAEARLAAARSQVAAADRAAGAQAAVAEAADAGARASSAQASAVRAQQEAAGRQAGRLDAVGADASAAARDQARTASDTLSAQADAAGAQQRATAAQARAARGQADAAAAQAEAAAFQLAAAEAAITRARVAAGECRVTAPRDGVVQLLPWEVGELVGPGANLATLVDLGEVWVTFYLPNAELAAAVVGGAATVAADAWPDRRFAGTIRRVATEPEFTPRNIQTRTDRDRLVFAVDVAVPNPDGALRPGMPADVSLEATP